MQRRNSPMTSALTALPTDSRLCSGSALRRPRRCEGCAGRRHFEHRRDGAAIFGNVGAENVRNHGARGSAFTSRTRIGGSRCRCDAQRPDYAHGLDILPTRRGVHHDHAPRENPHPAIRGRNYDSLRNAAYGSTRPHERDSSQQPGAQLRGGLRGTTGRAIRWWWIPWGSTAMRNLMRADSRPVPGCTPSSE